MEKDRLLYKLKEFHILEVYQVQLYSSQVSISDDPYIKKVFNRFAVREQEHVIYYENKIRELGESPPKVFTSAFKAAGFVTGKALGALSLEEQMKLGAAVENKAVKMYLGFIEEAAHSPLLAELTGTLWDFLIDEETHQFWFQEQLSRRYPPPEKTVV